MANGENINTAPRPQASGEAAAETSRATYETRGTKVAQAAEEARRAELLNEYMNTQKRLQEIERRRAEILGQTPPQPVAGGDNGGTQNVAPNAPSNQPNNVPDGQPRQSDAGAGNQGDNQSNSQAQPSAPNATSGASVNAPRNPSETNDVPQAGEGIANPERQAREARVKQKAKRNSGIKSIFKKAAVIGLSAVATIGIGTGLWGQAHADNGQVDQPQTSISQTIEQIPQAGETHEKGIYDGYGEKGMWLSSQKAGKYNFAAAKEVAEICNNDECEMMRYAERNQVETFADHLANVPDAVKNQFGISGFNGLSILATESALEGLSTDDYTNLQKQFDNLMDNAFVREITLNGDYENAFMRLKDPSGAVTHDNMELVKCTSHESNLKVTEFFWTDDQGNEIGSMVVKIIYDDDRNIIGGCMQVLNSVGSPVYQAMNKVTPEENTSATKVVVAQTQEKQQDQQQDQEDQDDQDDQQQQDQEDQDQQDQDDQKDRKDPTPNPTPTPDKEWGKTGDPNAGENRLPSDLVDPAAEVTQEENDATNAGNQGYVDDNQAAPGSGSENNGIDQETGFADSGITAEGANTEGGRLSGGENQGATTNDNTMAGENAYNPPAQVEQGRQVDAGGNAAQQTAQETGGETGSGATAGGNNYSNSAEETAIANGDF